MIFNFKKHNFDLYSNILALSRNIFFYDKLRLKDNFENRIYLMFIHFSILLIIAKKKGTTFDQISYDTFFNCIENDLRESGLGDVSVNKKMKDINKILYDILLKIDSSKKGDKSLKINSKLILKYFQDLNDINSSKYKNFEQYFISFYDFCFELPLNNMIRDLNKYKF